MSIKQTHAHSNERVLALTLAQIKQTQSFALLLEKCANFILHLALPSTSAVSHFTAKTIYNVTDLVLFSSYSNIAACLCEIQNSLVKVAVNKFQTFVATCSMCICEWQIFNMNILHLNYMREEKKMMCGRELVFVHLTFVDFNRVETVLLRCINIMNEHCTMQVYSFERKTM